MAPVLADRILGVRQFVTDQMLPSSGQVPGHSLENRAEPDRVTTRVGQVVKA